MKKGQRRPVELVRLVIGESLSEEHVRVVATAEKLRQSVTAKLVSGSLVLEARPAT